MLVPTELNQIPDQQPNPEIQPKRRQPPKKQPNPGKPNRPDIGKPQKTPTSPKQAML